MDRIALVCKFKLFVILQLCALVNIIDFFQKYFTDSKPLNL